MVTTPSVPSSCAPQSLWKMVVPPDHATLANNPADANVTLHDVAERNVVESAGFFTNDTWLEYHFHPSDTFGPNSDDVCVWELARLLLVKCSRIFELCVVIHTNATQLLCDIPSKSPSPRKQ